MIFLVLSKHLDEEILSKFLETLNQKFDPDSELDLISEYLTAMTKVERFDFIVKMLDNKVKEGKIFSCLSNIDSKLMFLLTCFFYFFLSLFICIIFIIFSSIDTAHVYSEDKVIRQTNVSTWLFILLRSPFF